MPTEKSSLDYSKMLFNVYEVSLGTDLCFHFKQLALHDEFQKYGGTTAGLPHKDSTIRHIVQFYDKSWPLQGLQSFQDRLDRSLTDAGFKRDKKGEWPNEIQRMVRGEIKEVNLMIKCFLFKIQNSRKFNLYNGMERALQDIIDNMHMAMEDLDADKKERAFKLKIENSSSALKMIEELEKLERDLFQDRDDIKMIGHTDLAKSSFEEGYAEKIAREYKAKFNK